MRRALKAPRSKPVPQVRVLDTMRVPAAAINPAELLGAEIPVHALSAGLVWRVVEISYDEDDEEEFPGTALLHLERMA